MAAKPKLTPEQWENARKVWEADPRKGFSWLIAKLSLPVSDEAVRQRSKAEEWSKCGSGSKAIPKFEQEPKLGKKQKPSLENSPKLGEQSPANTIVERIMQDESAQEQIEEERSAHHLSKYKPVFDEQARKICLLGATDAELADFFEVAESTINLWKKKHPSFSESVKRGKLAADADVAESLYHRAIGYSHPEVKVFCNAGEIITYDAIKHYPPDTKAAFIWLKNRQSKKWRDKQEDESNGQLDKAMIEALKTVLVEKLAAARARQQQVYIERGIVIDG